MCKLFIAIFSFLVLSSCALGLKTEVTSKPVNTNEVQTTKESTYEKSLEEASPKIKASEEFKSCMDMNVPMCIQSAGMQLAQSNRSVEFCSELGTQEQKDGCIFAVTIIKLQETKDKNLCNDLGSTYKNECNKIAIQTIAIEKNDSSICKELTQQTGSGIINNEEDNNHVDYCIMGVVTSSANPAKDACDSIISPQIKEICISAIRGRENIKTPSSKIQN